VSRAPRRLRTVSSLAGAAAIVAAALAAGGCGASSEAKSAQAVRAPSAERIAVELALTADSVSWTPVHGGRDGTLVLSGVGPRMAVMTKAPAKQVAVLPAHFLATDWRVMFAKQKLVTNAILSYPGEAGSRRVVALAIELVRSGDAASRFVFRVRHLERPSVNGLGARPATFEGATLLVDPVVDATLKNLWAWLSDKIFGTFVIPKDPVTFSASTDRYATFNKASIYKGPITETYRSTEEWGALQKKIFDAAGNWSDVSSALGTDLTSPRFRGASYSGLAFIPNPFRGKPANPGPGDITEDFDPDYAQETPTPAPDPEPLPPGFGKPLKPEANPNGADWGTVQFRNPSSVSARTVIKNSSINLVRIETLDFQNSDVGGLSMRGTQVDSLSASNSAFSTVDWSGARFNGGSVINSVFKGIRVGIAKAGGANDPVRGAAGTNIRMRGVDFSSTSFEDSSFANPLGGGATLDHVTFEGCGFKNVDFSDATITGSDGPVAGTRYTFSPTFKNSVFEKVKFDGATLRNVSFAGVDFTQGEVSFKGATFSNVDFTGAIGLQDVDFTDVKIAGDVYGLGPVRSEFDADAFGASDKYLRSVTFDDEEPQKDAESGYDIDPAGFLIVPETGVRLKIGADGKPHPIDPRTGRVMVDPDNPRQQLAYEPSSTDNGIYNPADHAERFPVNFETGELAR
jgi:uncharacterized protein YjbI with pentapeptide repeats